VLIAAQRVGAQHHLPKRCINRRSRPLEPQRYRRRRPGSVTQNGRDWCQGSSSSMRCEPYNLRAADGTVTLVGIYGGVVGFGAAAVDQLWVVGISGGSVELGDLMPDREAVGHFGSPFGCAEQVASWSKMGGDAAEGR
jgi:hypothetical protein